MSKLTKIKKLALGKIEAGESVHIKRSFSFGKRNYYY